MQQQISNLGTWLTIFQYSSNALYITVFVFTLSYIFHLFRRFLHVYFKLYFTWRKIHTYLHTLHTQQTLKIDFFFENSKLIVESNVCHYAKVIVIFVTQFGYIYLCLYSTEHTNVPIFPTIPITNTIITNFIKPSQII